MSTRRCWKDSFCKEEKNQQKHQKLSHQLERCTYKNWLASPYIYIAYHCWTLLYLCRCFICVLSVSLILFYIFLNPIAILFLHFFFFLNFLYIYCCCRCCSWASWEERRINKLDCCFKPQLLIFFCIFFFVAQLKRCVLFFRRYGRHREKGNWIILWLYSPSSIHSTSYSSFFCLLFLFLTFFNLNLQSLYDSYFFLYNCFLLYTHFSASS